MVRSETDSFSLIFVDIIFRSDEEQSVQIRWAYWQNATSKARSWTFDIQGFVTFVGIIDKHQTPSSVLIPVAVCWSAVFE